VPADAGYRRSGGFPSLSTVLFNSFPHWWQENVCNSNSGRLSAGVRRMIVIVPEHRHGSRSDAPKLIRSSKLPDCLYDPWCHRSRSHGRLRLEVVASWARSVEFAGLGRLSAAVARMQRRAGPCSAGCCRRQHMQSDQHRHRRRARTPAQRRPNTSVPTEASGWRSIVRRSIACFTAF